MNLAVDDFDRNEGDSKKLEHGFKCDRNRRDICVGNQALPW